MANVTISTAQLSDLDAVAELFDLYRQFYRQQPNRQLATAFIRERMSKRESIIFLATDADMAMGFCQLYPSFCSVSAVPIYILYDLFVKPECRGKKVAHQLMQAAETLAKENGVRRLELSTAKTNHTAQSLYESLGWIKDEAFFYYSKPIDAE